MTEAERGLLKLEGASKKLDGSMKSTGLQTGRLGNQFANLAGHIAGVHPVVGNLAGVLGNFAIGGAVTVGVLGGVAAIALAYDALTSSAREATKAQDEAVKSLANMLRVKAGGPTGETATQVARAHGQLARLEKREAELKNEVRANQGIPGFTGAAILAGSEGRLRDVQVEMENLKNIIIAAEKVMKADISKKDAETLGEAQRKQAAAHAKVEAALRKQQSDLISYNQLMKQIYGDISLLEPMTSKARAELLTSQRDPNSGDNRVRAIEFGKVLAESIKEDAMVLGLPTIDLNAGLTKEQIKQREKMGIFIDDANRNADKLSDAIWGSAAQLANSIVSSLNIGGGGKGSNIGGAVGGTAGFALGYAFGGGPVGGAIGSTIGNLLGSAVGGMFDSNKKAVDTNTQAIRQNTAALLLNTPSGYKVAGGRFNATDVRELKRVVPSYNARGGAVASI